MDEYFIVANSNAAPFISDRSTHYVVDVTVQKALETFIAKYDHPCGLFAANVYLSADAYHKGQKPLVAWRSEKALLDEMEHSTSEPKGAFINA